jgi:hypothetical protein
MSGLSPGQWSKSSDRIRGWIWIIFDLFRLLVSFQGDAIKHAGDYVAYFILYFAIKNRRK